MSGLTRMVRPLLAVTTLTIFVSAAFAQLNAVPGTRGAYLPTSEQATELLGNAQRLMEQGRWAEAVAVLNDAIDRFPDRVIALGDGLYVSVRDYCHMLVARSGPEGLAAYRVRVDARAEELFRRARMTGDRALLREIVERYFCSSWGDDALDLLADYAFQAGRFDEAIALWSRLIPEDSQPQRDGKRPVLRYPGTDLDVATLVAKQIVALAFSGDRKAAYERYKVFRARFPDAVGRLAGREDLWVHHLGKVLEGTPPVAMAATAEWPTFGRTPQRTGHAQDSVDIGSVQWSVALPEVVQTRPFMVRQMPAAAPQDQVPYHPIVAQGYVIVCNQTKIVAYRLQDGPGEAEEPAWTFQLQSGGVASWGRVPYMSVSWPQFTLTASGDRLYARLGVPSVPPLRKAGRVLESYVVCLQLSAEGRLVWRARVDERDTIFEGAPVVVRDRLYIAARTGGSMLRSTVYCYDARTGRLLWRRLVCESPQSGRYYDRLDHAQSLMTVAQGMVYYATNLGAVAALDAQTGDIRWIWTYPRKARSYYTRSTLRASVRAAIYQGGRLFVAPADADMIVCLDATTGEPLWATTAAALDATGNLQMLGVADGRLILSGEQVMAVEAATGRKLWQFPPAGGRLSPRGRGVIAGQLVYVPDATQIHVIDIETGLPDRPAVELRNQHHQQPGNLIVADGYLIVAGQRLAVLCEYGVLIKRYREQLAHNPGSAQLHMKLAKALEATGQLQEAAVQYRAALAHAKPGEQLDGAELARVCRARLYRLLGSQATERLKEGKYDETIRLLQEAVTVAPDLQAELQTRLRLAHVWEQAGKPEVALRSYQEILTQDRLRSLTVAVARNRSVRADVVVHDRIAALLEAHGRALYEPYEQQVQRLHEQARQQRNSGLLRRLLDRYPNSTQRYRLWLDLGTLLAGEQRWSEAADAFRVAASESGTPAQRAVALVGLARALEAQRLWGAAARVLYEAKHAAPEAVLPQEQGGIRVAEYVERKLSQEAFRWTLQRQEGLALPLGVKWRRDWGQGTRVLVARGTPPVGMKPVFLVQRSRSVACVDALTGAEMWRIEAHRPIQWAGFVADKLVLADDSRVLAVALPGGDVAWRYEFATRPPGEFAAEAAGYEPDEAPGNPTPRPGRRKAPVQWLQERPPAPEVCGVADDRLYVLGRTGELVALAAADGAQLWSFRPTTGRLGRRIGVSTRHLVVQNVGTNRVLVLDADGRVRWELEGAGGEWSREPVWVDSSRVCVISAGRTAQLLDVAAGQVIWQYKAPGHVERGLEAIVGPGGTLCLLAGSELSRLDPQTGDLLWSVTISQAPLARDDHVWLIDRYRFYCVTRSGNLRAWSLEDGRLLWQHLLTAAYVRGTWRIARSGRFLIAYPARPQRMQPLIPVVVLGADAGKFQQRLALAPLGDQIELTISGSIALLRSPTAVQLMAQDNPWTQVAQE